MDAWRVEDNNTQVNTRCYLGIFANTNTAKTESFYFGSLYLLKYYTYFDAGNETTSLSIGLGFKNVSADIL